MTALCGHGRALALAAALASALATAILACGPPSSGPVEIAWDRDPCAHCYMTIGDRRAAAQLRLEPGAEALAFDDLGCALLFLDARDLDARETGAGVAELWVRDASGQGWIDAREARFAAGAITPMEYGFTAATDPSALGLAEVWQRVREMEDERRSARR